MKKLFLSIFFAAGIFVILSQGEIVWSNRLYLDEPQVHKIEKGEYLSKLAQRYYGDPQRWRELALINRAPNPDHVEVGEEILVPAANKAAEINRAKTLTQVNTIVRDQEGLAVREPSAPITDASPTMPTSSPELNKGNGAIEPEPITPVMEDTPAPIVEENGFPWRWVGIGVALLAIAGFILYRRRQSGEQEVSVNVEKKENGFEEFRSRRQYGMPAKSQTADQKKDIEVTA